MNKTVVFPPEWDCINHVMAEESVAMLFKQKGQFTEVLDAGEFTFLV